MFTCSDGLLCRLIHGVKEPTCRNQNYNLSHTLIFGGSVKVRECLYTWVNTILNHIDTTVIFPMYEGSCVVHRPEWYLTKRKLSKISIP